MPRSYNSARRADAARETRAAILQAAAGLFAEHGYSRTTLAAVAERAGVALNTVYTSVGGKPALIEALVEQATGDDAIDAVLEEISSLTDAGQILHRLAAGTGEVTRRQAVVLRVLLANRASEPVVAAAADSAVAVYRARIHRVAERLVALGATAQAVDRVAQVLWFYFGTGAWDTVAELGWDADQAEPWLAAQASAALFGEGAVRA